MDTTYQLSKVNKSLKTVRQPKIRERLLMVKAYYQQRNFRDASKYCGRTHGTVKYWKDRYEQEGLKGLNTRRQTGRPPKLSLKKSIKIKQMVLRKISHESWQTKRIREYIQQQSGIRYSSRQVIRIAQNWGLSKITPRQLYVHSKEQDRRVFLKEKQGNSSQKAFWLDNHRSGGEYLYLGSQDEEDLGEEREQAAPIRNWFQGQNLRFLSTGGGRHAGIQTISEMQQRLFHCLRESFNEQIG